MRCNSWNILGRFLILGVIWSLGQTATAQLDKAELAKEYNEKFRACASGSGRDASLCRRQCAVAQTMLSGGPYSDADIQKQMDGCNIHFERAGLSLDSADPFTEDEQAVMAADALKKSQTCGQAAARTRETRNCVRQCTGAAQQLRGEAGVDVRVAERAMTFCQDAFAAAGFTAGAAPALRPTREQQLAALPEKAAYCSNVMSAPPCAGGNVRESSGRCNAARACEVNCGDPNMAADLASTDRRIRIRASQRLGHCERSYEELVD